VPSGTLSDLAELLRGGRVTEYETSATVSALILTVAGANEEETRIVFRDLVGFIEHCTGTIADARTISAAESEIAVSLLEDGLVNRAHFQHFGVHELKGIGGGLLMTIVARRFFARQSGPDGVRRLWSTREN
jgi:hypothetical protein